LNPNFHRMRNCSVMPEPSFQRTLFACILHSQSLQSRLGLELILIFCSRFLVMKFVMSPSWLTVPSSSRAEEIVARRPSDWPLLPPPRDPEPPVLLLSCIPRTFRTQTWAMM
uniref:Uncharacterized protein n=1 Tax=Gouania willdenowi TaxID=441366 RepID=A0A8C5EPT4_GOUWI